MINSGLLTMLNYKYYLSEHASNNIIDLMAGKFIEARTVPCNRRLYDKE